MQSSFTQGPWAVYVNAPSDIVIRKMSKDGYELCAIARVSSGYANARLITAAPELLDACKTFAEWLRREDAGFDHATHNRDTKEGEAEWRKWYDKNLELCATAQEQARAAIAKATGENT